MHRFFAILISLWLIATWPTVSLSQGRGIALIRDAEIENTIRTYAAPIFEAAGLENAAISIYLVNDRSLNAFVAGGQNIFVHTGLLLAAENPQQVIGVLAHETGHITGGHLARSSDAFRSATAVSMISILAGVAAMAAGAADAGAALLGSSGGFAQRAFFKYSRTQESSADQAALTFLNASEQSATGLIEFFERLISEEIKITTNRDPYIRSHPLTRQRITRLFDGATRSPYWDKPASPELIDRHHRMRAKLRGFLLDPQDTFNIYPRTDRSLYARYARAVAFHKAAEMELALATTDSLLDEKPKDPYFHELKGQILFESGKVTEAIEPYRNAVKYAPGETLLRVSFAQAIIASEDPSLNEEAIRHLKVANQRDPYNPFAWHQLAIAYSRDGRQELADLATAERYLLTGRFRDSIGLAERAATQISEDSPDWWRAQDVVNLATQLMEKQGR
ncbi:MAG: M48 family metalloprotease [Sphingomonadales bacterium]